MLFNSPFFIFVFLPITVFVFYFLRKKEFLSLSIAWLVGASLFFYGWWNPIYLILILSSILFNYFLGKRLSPNKNSKNNFYLLTLGIVTNVGLLIYFKYTHFFIGISNDLFRTTYSIEAIILPLAISFFTFQQIAYLVDAYKGKAQEYNFIHYCLFVTFFPQLIAGPIVHHSEMLPQFAKNTKELYILRNLVIGISIFSLGLFKKVILADGLAVYANPIFDGAETGITLSLFEAWFGSLAYLFQLYFDFSGYSDMAIGLAAIFGIVLPLNFNSPLKSHNIITFW
jgi:D-alanyl-lipoteichoic acid acyltransferase DltB (MBOAT superfamily)